MFSKALLVFCCLVAVAAAVEVQLCQNGEGTGDVVETEFSTCSNISLADGSTMYFEVESTGGSAKEGNLTGLLDTFTDGMCTVHVNMSMPITCTCDESADIHFKCEGSAFMYPSVALIVAALMALML
eukprot:TRINITY_DN100_c0_g1_i1.p1 TRINITY_DN100_c0_g1~~TRINITY_DN100_c0_g1_i1.p1  ORF type:complete len:127 (+),score=46.50 TRINITY_DN100_c0_g1_i1:71-451(+)